jgi:predicted transcriptional regulator
MATHIQVEIESIRTRLLALPNTSDFAKRCGVSRATLYRIINGWPNPNLKTLERISAELAKEQK